LVYQEVLFDKFPETNLTFSVMHQFWEELDVLVSSVPISEKLFIRGDLNGHVDVGSTRVGFNGVHGASDTRIGTKKGRVS
jgi:hypothetical protein